VQADAVNGGQTDGTGDDVLDLLEPVLERVISLDELFAVIVEHLAFAGQAKFLLAALDEQRFELALQRTDLLAHGRLGDVIDLRRFGETLRFGQITKYF